MSVATFFQRSCPPLSLQQSIQARPQWCRTAVPMADHLANGLSEESISDYASSSAGTDPLEDFLNRYTFIIDPECCLKLHKR
jgi:hypothetical protein